MLTAFVLGLWSLVSVLYVAFVHVATSKENACK